MSGCLCKDCINFGSGDCVSPINLKISNISNISLLLSWKASDNVQAYEIEYKKSTDLSWGILPQVTTDSIMITGLNPSTNYDFRVKAICSSRTDICYSLTISEKTFE